MVIQEIAQKFYDLVTKGTTFQRQNRDILAHFDVIWAHSDDTGDRVGTWFREGKRAGPQECDPNVDVC